MDLEPLRTKLIADTNQFTPQIQRARDEFGRFIKTTDGATQAMQRHTRGVESATKALRDAQKQAKDHVHSINDISRALNAQRNVYHTLKGAVVDAYEAASEGAKIMAAEQFFKNAGKSIGDYRKATNGMVSDAELMKKANLADSMGIDEATFKKLVMVAEASALKTGQSFDHMFNSIIVGTARSSRLLLDNLGIIVSVKQANETYAKSVNKVVEELTAEEKQLAFVNEVAKQSQGTLDEYANTTDRTAESFSRFDANVQNLADTIKITLAEAFSKILPEISSALKSLRGMIEAEDWHALGSYMGFQVLRGLAYAFSKVDPGGFFEKARAAFEAQANLIAYKSNTEQQAVDNFNKQEALTAKQEIEGLTNESIPSLIARFEALGSTGSAVLDTLVADLIRFNKAADNFLNIRNDPNFGKKAPSEPVTKPGGRGSKGKADKEYEFPQKLADVIARAMADLEARWGLAVASPFTKDLTNALSLSATETNRQTKRLAEIQRLLDEAALERAQEIAGRVQGATESVLSGGGLLSPILGAIAPALGSSITAALSAAEMGTAAAGPLGGVLAGVAVVLVGLIDKLKPVTNLIGAIVDGLSLLIQHGLGDLLATLEPLSPALRELLAAVGILVGSALRPFISMMAIGVGIVTAVVQAVSFLLVVLSPFIEAIFTVVGIFVTFGTALIGLIGGVEGVVGGIKTTLAVWGSTVLGAAIAFNNAIVGIVQSLGFKGFGKYLDYDDFQMGDDEAIEDNTDAVAENTRALRDFSREFRNLPQNYKVAGAIYNASAPGMGRASLGGAIRIGSGTGLSAEDISNMNGLRDRL